MVRRVIVIMFLAGLLAVGVSMNTPSALLDGDVPDRDERATVELVVPGERPVTRPVTDHQAALWALLVLVVGGLLSNAVRQLITQRGVVTQPSRGTAAATRAPPIPI
jgi:hypothetical protein